jgi:membrane protein
MVDRKQVYAHQSGRSFLKMMHLRWPILFMVMALVLAFLYGYAPNRGRPRFKWLSPAALVATLVWVVASLLFSIYVHNLASYKETYGSIGAVVILLMWFWLSAFIVLVGAEVDARLDRHRNDRRR